MANAPKIQDPTAAALSAIEEALALGKEQGTEQKVEKEKEQEAVKAAKASPAPEQTPAATATPESATAEPAKSEPARADATVPEPAKSEAMRPEPPRAEPVKPQASRAEPPRPEPARPEPIRRPQRPMRRAAANDDRQSVGQIVSRLHSKPSPTPIIVAGLLAALWLIGGVAWTAAFYAQDLAAGGLLDLLTQPAWLPVAAALLLPAVGFLLLGALIRRLHELRAVARSMAEVTVRLAEPADVSTDAVVTVGQAIRREVAALGDGIERAIARATELETMVKAEVSTLERAYDDNELRVRNLVDELHSERDAILSHAGRLREAIAHAHEAFTFDVEQVAERVNAGLNEATERVSSIVGARSDDARAQISAAGDLVIEAMTIKAGETTERMTQVGIEIGKALATRSAMVAEAFEESGNAVTAQITATGDKARETLTASLSGFDQVIAQRGTEIADRVTASSADLGRRITEGLEGFDQTVKVYGTGLLEQISQIVNSVSENTRESLTGFDTRVTAKIQEVGETLESRIVRIDQSLGQRAQDIDEKLTGFDTRMGAKIQEVGETLESRIVRADQSIGQRAQDLDEKLTSFDTRLAAKIQEAGEALETRITGIEKSLSERAHGLEGTMSGFDQRLAAIPLGVETKEIEHAHRVAASRSTAPRRPSSSPR